MSLKNQNTTQGKKPKKLKDLKTYIPFTSSYYVMNHFNVPELWFTSIWTSPTEYETALISALFQEIDDYLPYTTLQDPKISILDASLYSNFGERTLFEKYFEFIEKWDGYSEDYESVINNMTVDIKRCIAANRYKWGNLMESCLLEFNPLYNVDATEETTRTLEQDGTITGRKTGSDTNAHSGTIADAKTGKDTLKKTGTDTLEYEGSETTEYSGDEKMIYEGSEDIEYIGTESTAHAGSETHTKGGTNTSTTSRTTTESTSWYDAEKTVDQPTETDTLSFDHRTDEKQFQNRKDTTSFTDRQDIKSFDNRADTKSFDDRADARTLNLEDEQSYASTNTRTHNNTDTLTHNTTDTETRDLTDTERVLLRRFGNIGVTQSTQLLENFRNFVNYNIIDVVAHDIANCITEGVY